MDLLLQLDDSPMTATGRFANHSFTLRTLENDPSAAIKSAAAGTRLERNFSHDMLGLSDRAVSRKATRLQGYAFPRLTGLSTGSHMPRPAIAAPGLGLAGPTNDH